MKVVTLFALMCVVPVAKAEFCPDDGSKFQVDACHATFSSKSHPKAKDTNFKISYPIGWKAEESDRPNVIQKFTSDLGAGLETAIVTATDMRDANGRLPPKRDIEAMLSPENGQQQIPTGAKLISAERITIENELALALEFELPSNRAGIALMTRNWVVNFVQGNTLVQVLFMVAGPPDGGGYIEARMTSFKPVFKLMANSIVFPDAWAKPPAADTTSSAVGATRSVHGWQWWMNQVGIFAEIVGAALLVGAAYRSRSEIKSVENTWDADLATKLRDIVAGQAKTELAGFVLLAAGLVGQMVAAY